MRNATLARRLLLLATLAFATWNVVQKMSSQDKKAANLPELSEADKAKFAKEREMYLLYGRDGRWDVPRSLVDPDTLMRYDPLERNLHGTTVRGWPSVGGLIVAERVDHIELEYLQLDRSRATPRSQDAAAEDEFCRRLRTVGGKWWVNYGDYEWATVYKMRRVHPHEKEVLYLAWPEKGGVCVLRFNGQRDVKDSLSIGIPLETIHAAITMEERCQAIRACGGRFFEKPEDSEYVRPLLSGFGDHEKWDISIHGDGELLDV